MSVKVTSVKVAVTREAPVKPPIKEVTITLSGEAAEYLCYLMGAIGDGTTTDRPLKIFDWFTEEETRKIREDVISPIFYALRSAGFPSIMSKIKDDAHRGI